MILEEATHAYSEAIHIGRDAGNLHMVIIANSNLADILTEQGQLQRAANTYNQALQMAVRPDGQRSPLAGIIYAGLARLSYERNQLIEAGQYIHQCIDISQLWGDYEIQAEAFATLARVEHARGNLVDSQEAIQRAVQLANEHQLSPRRSTLLTYDLARLWLARENLEKVSELIKKRKLSVDDDIPYRREPEYIVLMRLLLVKKEYEAALALSERLFRQADAAGRLGTVIEILILQAHAFQAKKDPERALHALERALSLAQPEGYMRIFLDEGESMTRMLCQAQSRKIGSGYAADLLAQIGRDSGMIQPSMQLLIEPLTSRELEVLKLIEAGCSNQEISAQLVISITTVKRHISNIYTKLGAKNRTQAVALGKELNLYE